MSANARILDASLRHQVGLQRLSAGLVRRILALLNDVDEEVLAQISRRNAAVAARGFDTGRYTTARLQVLVAEIRATLRDGYRATGRELRRELVDLAEYEVGFQRELLGRSTGAALVDGGAAGFRIASGELRLRLLMPSIEQLRAIVDSHPFQGALMKDWVTDLSAAKLGKVQRAVKVGLVAGETNDQIIRRIRGTRAAGYRDGVLRISRDHAETWVRTAVQHVANTARDALYESNSDLVESVTWDCTLDDKSCFDCIARDQHAYSLPDHEPLDGGPEWAGGPGRLHPRDRCTSTPNLKSYRALGIDRKEAPAGTRSSLDGLVPARMTAEEWLRSHPESAATVYGKTRAKLFTEGKLSAGDMVKDDGGLWTLKELREREAAAFAGM